MALADDKKADGLLVDCQQSLVELRHAILSLAADLRCAAEAMALNQVMPERSLICRLEDVWACFEKLREEFHSACTSLGLRLAMHSLETIADLEEAIDGALKELAAAANWQAERSIATRVLSALCQTQCATNPKWEPLADFHADAERLKNCFETATSSGGEVGDARELFKSFAALYGLLADRDQLSLDETTALGDEARKVISAKIVFAALARGISLPAVEPPIKLNAALAELASDGRQRQDVDVGRHHYTAANHADAPSVGEPIDRTAAGAPGDRHLPEQPVADVQAKAAFELLGAAAAPPKPAPSHLTPDLIVFRDDHTTPPGRVRQRETATAVHWTAPDDDLVSAVAAGAARSLAGSAKMFALNDLVWRLLREGRLAPAWYIAQAVEQQNAVVDVPAALIESILYAPLLLSSVGSVADRIRDSLYAVRLPELSGDNDDEGQSIPRKLLMLAATLRPAILAPGSGALELFRQLSVSGHSKAATNGRNSCRHRNGWAAHFLSPQVPQRQGRRNLQRQKMLKGSGWIIPPGRGWIHSAR